VIDQWYSKGAVQQGDQEKYSDTCIEAIMMFKTVFRLAYRQARGFTQGILKLIFGSQHYSRLLETQVQENKMKIKALNQMTAHGMPISQPKAT